MSIPFKWQQECNYLARVADKRGNVREMGHSLQTFITYCEMQLECAVRDEQPDAAQYIEHVLDDMKRARADAITKHETP